jgi:hypothetical protein
MRSLMFALAAFHSGSLAARLRRSCGRIRRVRLVLPSVLTVVAFFFLLRVFVFLVVKI